MTLELAVAQYIFEALWSPATFIKMVIVIASFPLWSPVLRVMWQETKGAFEVMDARGGDMRGKVQRPVGQDPWLRIPRASHRRSAGGGAPRAGSPPPRAAARTAAPMRRSVRRTGF